MHLKNIIIYRKKVPAQIMITETKLAEFANSINLDEVVHKEPPHLDLHFLFAL